MALELYGTRSCPYTAELRDELIWDDRPFVEYDVERDGAARARLRALLPGEVSVPVLVEDGCVIGVGYGGRACYVSLA